MDTADCRFRRTGAGFDNAAKTRKHPHRFRNGNVRVGRSNWRADGNGAERSQRRRYLSFYLVVALYRSRRTHNAFYATAAKNRMD